MIDKLDNELVREIATIIDSTTGCVCNRSEARKCNDAFGTEVSCNAKAKAMMIVGRFTDKISARPTCCYYIVRKLIRKVKCSNCKREFMYSRKYGKSLKYCSGCGYLITEIKLQSPNDYIV